MALTFVSTCVRFCLNDVGWANGFNTSSTFYSTTIHKRPDIQSQAATAVVTVDTDMDTPLRDRLVRTRIANNFERMGQRASISFNIRDNKRSVEWLLKHSTSIQLRFNMFQHGCVQQNRTDVIIHLP